MDIERKSTEPTLTTPQYEGTIGRIKTNFASNNLQYAQGLADSLNPGINPNGPNVPMLNSLESIVKSSDN